MAACGVLWELLPRGVLTVRTPLNPRQLHLRRQRRSQRQLAKLRPQKRRANGTLRRNTPNSTVPPWKMGSANGSWDPMARGRKTRTLVNGVKGRLQKEKWWRRG